MDDQQKFKHLIVQADSKEELENISKVELHQYQKPKYSQHSDQKDSEVTTPEGLGTNQHGADDNVVG